MSFLRLLPRVVVITRAIYGRASVVMKKHPKKSLAAAFVPLLPIAHFGLKALSRHRLETPVLRKIEEGSRPTCIPSTRNIDRPLLEEELKECVCPSEQEYSHSRETRGIEGSFGVVIGPSGSGKTALLRKICKSKPEGVLYFEVFDPRCLAQDLGTAVGMVQQPTSPIDLFFTYVSGDSYAQYHKIPRGNLGMQYVFAGLEKQAVKYKSKYGRIPVLVIDGIDLLAKEDKKQFISLIDRAKFLANSHALKIILGSEGSVMPFRETSSKSRLADTVEVLDISDEEALNFFDESVPKELTRRIVSVCGGRFVHLLLARRRYFKLQRSGVEDIDVLFESIIKYLVVMNIKLNLTTLLRKPEQERQLHQLIMQKVFDGVIEAQDIAKQLNTSTESIEVALDNLVSCNFLRFTSEGDVVFHSRLVEWAFKRNMIDFGLTESIDINGPI